MSLTSPDARAVVAAVDRLTTQVKRLANAQSTPVAIIRDGVSTPVVGAPFPAGTCDASTLGVGSRHLGPCLLRSGHDGPVHRGPDGETWATVVAADAPTTRADDGPTRLPPAVYDAALHAARLQDSTAPADEDAERTARRDSIGILLSRAGRGVLTGSEAEVLRQWVETEIRDADTMRAVAAGNKRHVQLLYADLQQAQAKAGDLAETYKAERRRGDALAEERNQAWAERDGAANERDRLRDMLRSENQRANKAIERETTAEQAAEEARVELEQAQAALERVRALATEPGETNHYIARERLLATLDDTDQPEQS